MVLAIAAVKVFGVDVPTVGHIGSGLPSLGAPDIGLGDAGGLAAGGLGVMLIAFAEGLGAAKAFAAGGQERIDANRELVALGGANVASGLCSGMVVAGSLSKTAVNASAGGRTQLSALLAGALAVVALLFLTGPFEDLPTTTLAAIVIAAVVGLVDVRAVLALYHTYTKRLGREYGWVARPDFIAALAALLGVLVLGTLRGLFAGIGVSLLLLIYRASRPYVAVLGRTPGRTGPTGTSSATPTPTRPTTSWCCASRAASTSPTPTTSARRSSRPAPREGLRAVILDAETTPFVDVTAARVLADTRDELDARGVRLLLACNVGQVRDVLRCTTDDSDLTASYPTIDAAVQAVCAPGATRRPAPDDTGR